MMLSIEFLVNPLLFSGGIFKIATVAVLLNRNIFSDFWSTGSPNMFYQVSSYIAFQFRRKSSKQIFKMGPGIPFWISDLHKFSYF